MAGSENGTNGTDGTDGVVAANGATLGIATRPFASVDEAIDAVLDVMHRTVGLRTPFVARTNHGRFEVVAVDSRQGCPVAVGDTLPLEDSY